MDIAFAIIWWNDPSIIRTLESIPSEFHKFVIDGKFKDMKSKEKLSDETLRNRVKRFMNTVVYDEPNLTEPEKRNVYLEKCKNYDYVFIIDSDEYIDHASWLDFERTCGRLEDGFHQLCFDDKGLTMPRLMKNPKIWEYYLCHDVFRNRETSQILRGSKIKGEVIEDVILATDDKLRDKNYINLIKGYQEVLIKDENTIRKQH